MTPRPTRRALLRGAGVAVGLPLLESLARGATSPKRFVMMFSSGGTIADKWRPTGGETDFKLSPILQPLERHRGRVVVVDGLDYTCVANQRVSHHNSGMCAMFTGRPMLMPNGISEFGDANYGASSGGISIDQEVANLVGTKTRFRSLELGVQVSDRANPVVDRMSFRGILQPQTPQGDPWAVFKRLFSQPVGDAGAVERLRAQRRSVLDAVVADYADLGPTLTAEDRRRVDAHLTRVRELEASLMRETGGAACRPPVQGAPISLTDRASIPTIGRLQMDLLVTALACDLTRVGSIQWCSPVASNSFPWLGINRGQHLLSHEDADPVVREQLTRINAWYAEQLAYLIDKMKEVQEEGGTLMDRSVLVWGNELGRGSTHSLTDIPFVVAGNAGGAFRTGRFLHYDGVPHNQLLLSLLHAMGGVNPTFGDPKYCTGPLAGL